MGDGIIINNMTDPLATPALRMQRTFNAPVDRVFRAWSDPGELARWAWGSIGHDVTVDVDLRVGGAYRIATAHPGQATVAFEGTYDQIVTDRRLVYSLHWDAPMGYEAPDERVTVEFVGRGEQTDVTFVHEGVPHEIARDEHEKGWADTFDTLAQLLQDDG